MGHNGGAMLFSEELMCEPRVVSGVRFRPLCEEDFDRGYCDVLSELTVCGATREQFSARFREMQKACGVYHIVVGIDEATGRVVASGSVVLERKFIHACGAIGHVEDIVVSQCARGRHVGDALMKQLAHVAQRIGCYKVILNCSDAAKGFYDKCGYTAKEIEMVQYFNK